MAGRRVCAVTADMCVARWPLHALRKGRHVCHTRGDDLAQHLVALPFMSPFSFVERRCTYEEHLCVPV